jgi:hypothetical protein
LPKYLLFENKDFSRINDFIYVTGITGHDRRVARIVNCICLLSLCAVERKYSPSAEKARARPSHFLPRRKQYIKEKLKPGLLKQAIHSCVFVEAAAFLGAFCLIYTCYHRDEFTFNYYDLCLLVCLGILTRLSPAHTHTYCPIIAPRSPVPSAKDVERENLLLQMHALCPPPKTPAVYKISNHDPFCTYDRARRTGRRSTRLTPCFREQRVQLPRQRDFVSLKTREREKIINFVKCETQNGIFYWMFFCNLLLIFQFYCRRLS